MEAMIESVEVNLDAVFAWPVPLSDWGIRSKFVIEPIYRWSYLGVSNESISTAAILPGWDDPS